MTPKVFGDVYESHIRYWQEQATTQAVVVRSPVTAAALADMVQTILAHVDACLEFTLLAPEARESAKNLINPTNNYRPEYEKKSAQKKTNSGLFGTTFRCFLILFLFNCYY